MQAALLACDIDVFNDVGNGTRDSDLALVSSSDLKAWVAEVLAVLAFVLHRRPIGSPVAQKCLSIAAALGTPARSSKRILTGRLSAEVGCDIAAEVTARVACAAGETLTLFGRPLDLAEWTGTLPMSHVVDQLCDCRGSSSTVHGLDVCRQPRQPPLHPGCCAKCERVRHRYILPCRRRGALKWCDH